MNRIARILKLTLPFAVMMVMAWLFIASTASAQLHGGRIQKSCSGLKRCSGRCSVTTSQPCVARLACLRPVDGGTCTTCQAGETCVLGDTCDTSADCTGSQGFCVGGPQSGRLTCTPPTIPAGCVAGTECSACVPVQEAIAGDTMTCEILVTSVDQAADRITVSSITDEVHHASGDTGGNVNLLGSAFGFCRANPAIRCSAENNCPAGPAPRCSINDVSCMLPGVCLPMIGDFVGVVHTEPVDLDDVPVLTDTARATGVDTFDAPPDEPNLAYNIDFPGIVRVTPPPLPCRITGGGVINGMTDPTMPAETVLGFFGGQVGAPCGCIGCFGPFDNIQGSWQYSRKSKKGTMHAKAYNSLVCDLDDGAGPAPPQAPANKACFSGVAPFAATNGPKTTDVAFRVEVEDRGEPGVNDKLTVRIWIPSGNENAQVLAGKVCCTRELPLPTNVAIVRAPNIVDTSPLIHGNIQIHPALDASLERNCPKPRGVCVPLPTVP